MLFHESSHRGEERKFKQSSTFTLMAGDAELCSAPVPLYTDEPFVDPSYTFLNGKDCPVAFKQTER